MKFLKLFSLIMILFSNSCHTSRVAIASKYKQKITSSFANDMKNDHDYGMYAYGGLIRENIELFTMYFETQKKVTLDESRMLILNCVEELLNRINSNEKIRPYLSVYPFTSDGLVLDLLFRDFYGNIISDGQISTVYLLNGKIFYETYDQQTKRYIDVQEESYQDALKIVKEQKHQVQSTPALSDG